MEKLTQVFSWFTHNLSELIFNLAQLDFTFKIWCGFNLAQRKKY